MLLRWVVEAEVPDTRHNPGAATDNLTTILDMLTNGNARVIETLRVPQADKQAEDEEAAPVQQGPPTLRLVGGRKGPAPKKWSVAVTIPEAPEVVRGRENPSRPPAS